jgi:putative tryptophan/tyrosine transport system substrate-binding protein
VRGVVVGSVAALLGLATVAGCAGTEAADAGPPAVVVLRAVADPYHADLLDELLDQRLVVGRDLDLVPLDGEVVHADLDEVTAELDGSSRAPAVLVAFSTPYAELAAERFPDVPTVSVVNDPVASGLVEDRDRPEGRITGVTFVTPMDRTLQLTAEVLGGLDRIGYLGPADDRATRGPRERLGEAAERVGVEVVEVEFADDAEVADAVDELVEAEVDAVLLASANEVLLALDQLEQELTGAGLPVVANNGRATFAVAVLEPDGAEVRRQIARQIARLLRGDPVATVPVEDPRRFRTILDRDRIAELGLPALDEVLLRQADEVR